MFVSMLKPRARKVKILATLCPASSTPSLTPLLSERGQPATATEVHTAWERDPSRALSKVTCGG